MKKKNSYLPYLLESLKNPQEMIEYLECSLDNLKAVGLAIMNVIEVQREILKTRNSTSDEQ